MSGANASAIARSRQPIVLMAGVGIASWLLVSAVVDGRARVEILFGMLGPLAAAVSTWLLVSWAYRECPQDLTGVMAAAFVLKMIFFGAYVAVMLRIIGFRPVPFVVSFTGYFVGIYLIEALYLKRLFSQRSS